VDRVGCPLDSDGDGVPDYLDKCPNTPRGVRVDREGCAVPVPSVSDSDGDGVPDNLDKCPDTPKGAKVDERGCWAYLGAVLFEVNKADLRPQVFPALDNAVEVMMKNPDLKVEIQGHTDSTGPAAYNQALSERRARSVYDYLVERGVPSGRLIIKGYGLTRPAYPNTTKEGRAKNRRVEFAPVTR
jgi:OOP family OmpA-OmpF porin